MNLNDLLKNNRIDPSHVIVLRHRPSEPELRKKLPRWAAEKPELFNAYQQAQGETLEKVMAGLIEHGYIASFIGHEPSRAVFVGLYAIAGAKAITAEQYTQIPANQQFKALGVRGFHVDDERNAIRWFDLRVNELFSSWKGKLIVGWPPPERSWWRRSHRNEMPVIAILEQSMFDEAMPKWDKIMLSQSDLAELPSRWKDALSHWRGIYFIFDQSDRKGYVGAAYGKANLYGRWQSYATTGHGGNKLLVGRDPANFRFSILQRVSPDMEAAEVIELEGTWKDRLHTRPPFGLNDN